MIYNLIETATGRNISQSSTPISDPSAGFHVIETADNDGIWNEQTLQFDPFELHRVIALGDFISLFTNAEKDDLFEAAKTIKKANTFVEVIKLVGSADLDGDFIITHVNLMESAGIIGSGRAAEILS